MGKFGLGLVALCLWPSLALADKLLSGEDAAYIDWSVNNCATKSTDKEHALVDQANAKDAAGSCASIRARTWAMRSPRRASGTRCARISRGGTARAAADSPI
jgi:hypothetical protein